VRAAAITLMVVVSTAVAMPATACTLYRVVSAEQAELRVYFTRFEKEDETGGKYKDCDIVETPEADTITYAVTRFRQDANVVVHPSNWPEE
jgi:hypothetical protein